MPRDALVRISADRVAKVASLKKYLGLATNKETLEWIVDNALLLSAQGALSPLGADTGALARSAAKTSAAAARGVEDLRNALLVLGSVLSRLVPPGEWPETPADALAAVPDLLVKVLEGE